ncbi:MAG: hypothetical protein IJV07_02560 [Alphaproteobacteria bacterium]|nr:hypothetical protein [Alphaproteobacteria bacterium]
MAEQNNRQMAGAPRQRDEELYAQISAGDEMEFRAGKTKSSLTMSLMIWYMRMTLTIDEKRRQYQKLFHTLGLLWAGVMSVLYLCGIAMFVILVGSYMRFEGYVREYLEKHDILYSKIEVPHYIVSQVDLFGLHDKDETYNIDKLSVSSTFADFLNRRAKSVSLKGVKLIIDSDKNKPQKLLSVLSNLNNTGKTGVRVDSLDVSDATLIIQGKNFKIPVSLNLTGVYGRETNISAYVNVNEPNLTLKGPLFIRNSGRGTRWELEIHSGSVAFPNRPQETLMGKVSVETEAMSVNLIEADLTTLYDRLRKNLNASLKREKKLFKGSLSMRWTDVSNATQPEERTTLNFNFNGLAIDSSGEISSSDNIQVDLSTKYSQDIQVESLTANLKGNLSCHLFDTCSYDLTMPSEVMARRFQFPIQGVAIQNVVPFKYTLLPGSKLFNITFKSGRLDFNADVKDLLFRGRQTEANGIIAIQTPKANATGYFNFWNKDISAGIQLTDLSYDSPSLKLKKGTFIAENIFDDTSRRYLSSPQVSLQNVSALKAPFALEYSSKDNISDLVLRLENNRIQVLFGGYLDFLSGQIDGQLVVPTIDLGEIKQPLNRLSDLIPAEFQKISGQVTAYGRLSGNIYGNINGPFYLALSNIDLRSKNLSVQGLNTALLVQSAYPFVTEADQKFYISRIHSFIPLSNIDLVLRLDERFAQLKKLTAEIAGIQLTAEEALIPYKNVGTLVYLRSVNSDLSRIAQMVQLKNWNISGAITGSLLLPIEIRNMALNVKNSTLQVSDALLRYTGPMAEKPSVLENNTEVSVRSGSLSLDSSADTPDKIKLSLVLDTLLKPTNLRKTIRDTYTGNLLDIVSFKEETDSRLPIELDMQIRHIQEQAQRFRVQ